MSVVSWWIYAVFRLYIREIKVDSEITDLRRDSTHLFSGADRPSSLHKRDAEDPPQIPILSA